MPKTSVYLPVELHTAAIRLGINVSELVRRALREQIESQTHRCPYCEQPLPQVGDTPHESSADT